MTNLTNKIINSIFVSSIFIALDSQFLVFLSNIRISRFFFVIISYLLVKYIFENSSTENDVVAKMLSKVFNNTLFAILFVVCSFTALIIYSAIFTSLLRVG